MSNGVEIIIAILGSGVLSTLITCIFSIADRKSKRRGGIAAGTRMLLYDKIKYLGKKHIAEKYITSEDLEDLIRMHKIYHDELDGNGYLDAVMEQVKKLPISQGVDV